MLPLSSTVDVRQYHDDGGRRPFGDWFDRLNSQAARKVTTALYRVGLGISPTPKALGPVFTGARSTSAPATECILEKTASGQSSFLVVERNNASRATSGLHTNDGKITSIGRNSRRKRNEYGFDTRF